MSVSKLTLNNCFQIYPFTGEFYIFIFPKSCKYYCLNVPYFHFPFLNKLPLYTQICTLISCHQRSLGLQWIQMITDIQNKPLCTPYEASEFSRLSTHLSPPKNKGCWEGWKNGKAKRGGWLPVNSASYSHAVSLTKSR